MGEEMKLLNRIRSLILPSETIHGYEQPELIEVIFQKSEGLPTQYCLGRKPQDSPGFWWWMRTALQRGAAWCEVGSCRSGRHGATRERVGDGV